jgi:hypothetical protein
MVFTRLDKLDDVFEGIETSLLQRDLKHASARSEPSKLLNTLSRKSSGKIKHKKKLAEYESIEEIEAAQKSQYVNCWFSGDRESMAMWNMYSNSDSVAIRAEFTDLVEALRTPFKELIKANDNNISIIGHQITYLRLNPFDEKQAKEKVRFSALKKDVSFEYENEYRFLIIADKSLNTLKPFYSIPVDPAKMNFTIVTHPNMEDWKFKNIQKLVRLSGYKLNIEKSSTILRMKTFD